MSSPLVLPVAGVARPAGRLRKIPRETSTSSPPGSLALGKAVPSSPAPAWRPATPVVRWPSARASSLSRASSSALRRATATMLCEIDSRYSGSGESLLAATSSASERCRGGVKRSSGVGMWRGGDAAGSDGQRPQRAATTLVLSRLQMLKSRSFLLDVELEDREPFGGGLARCRCRHSSDTLRDAVVRGAASGVGSHGLEKGGGSGAGS